MTKALVVLSGGQDSTTCLAWALKHYDEAETIGFFYGQRHSVELECRKRFLEKFRARFPSLAEGLGRDTLAELPSMEQFCHTAMTSQTDIEKAPSGLPTTFVPARNLIFLCFAAAKAYDIGADALVTGVSQQDYSGYPDCRAETIEALEKALCLGLDRKIKIETPCMNISKAQEWELAEEIGGRELVELIARESHTCYTGDHSTAHDWGYGCGKCPACVLRAKGWEEYEEHRK